MNRILIAALSLILMLQGIAASAQSYILRYGLNEKQYQHLFDSLSPKGWVPQHIDIVNINGTLHFAGMWMEENNVTWEARHNLTEKQYQQMFDLLTPKGYVPFSLTVYRNEQSQIRYAAIWRKEPDTKFIARHGLTERQYTQLLEESSKQGYYPYSIAVYEDNGTTKFAVALQIHFQHLKGQFIEKHNINAATSQQTFDDLSPKGFMPMEVIGYTLNGEVNFALFWYNDLRLAWQVRHNLTAEKLQSYENTFKQQHYIPYRIKGYNNNGVINYIAGWLSAKN